ncbi:MAG: signal peptide peptidase SppA, partial [Proteobacteria bacterium]
ASLVTVFILIGMVSLILSSASKSASHSVVENSILHMRLRGEIVEKHRPLDFNFLGNKSIFSEEKSIGLYELTRAIEAAKTDSRIKGIYIEMRGFGAGWATLTALHNKLEEFKATKKWIYAYGDRYDEKSYYLATAANQIFIQPHGEVEFNGLGMNQPFLKGLIAKLELEPRVFRVGKFKAAIEPLILDHMSAENRKQNEELLGDIWAEVRKSVATSSKIEEKRVDEIAGGLLAVSAEEGQKLGLFTETIFEDALEDRMRGFTVGKDEDLELVTPGQLLRDSTATAKLQGAGPKKIALVFAEGEIQSGIGSSDSIGSETFREDLIEAKEDEDVAAIVVRINSPGGDALASDVIWREMMKVDEKIPVVISMGDVAASGGYYMASAGRYIYAEPTTITGSIGVFGIMFNAEKFFKNKAAVNFDRVVTHPYADIGNATRPMTDLEASKIQGEVERVYKRFLDVVQEGRGYEKREDLESIAEGRVWSGTRAKEIGLVDEIGGLESAVKKAAEFANVKDYKIVMYPQQTDPIMQFIERFSGDAVRSWMGEVLLGKSGYANVRALGQVAEQIPLSQVEMKSGIYMRMLKDIKIQ